MMEIDNPEPQAKPVTSMPENSGKSAILSLIESKHLSPDPVQTDSSSAASQSKINVGVGTERVNGKSKNLNCPSPQPDNGEKRKKIEVINLESEDSDNDNDARGNKDTIQMEKFHSPLQVRDINFVTMDMESDDDDIEVLSEVDYKKSQYQMKWIKEVPRESTKGEISNSNESPTVNTQSKTRNESQTENIGKIPETEQPPKPTLPFQLHAPVNCKIRNEIGPHIQNEFTPSKKRRFSINKASTPSSQISSNLNLSTNSLVKTPECQNDNGHNAPRRSSPLVHFLDDVFPILLDTSISLLSETTHDDTHSNSNANGLSDSSMASNGSENTSVASSCVDGRFILSPEQRIVLINKRKSVSKDKDKTYKIRRKHSLAYYHDPVHGTLCNICGSMDTSNKELQSFVLTGEADLKKPFHCLSCNEKFAHGELTAHKAQCLLTYDDPDKGGNPRKYRMMACDKCVLSYKQAF